MDQQFCLKWNNHLTNMLSVFGELYRGQHFIDVTLACEGHSLKCHRMVLSACSPYFQSLFTDNPCKHPIVIMNNIKYSDLKAIVEFMYKGEVNVNQDQLTGLLKTAETLKVKGLAEVQQTTPGNQTIQGQVIAASPVTRPVSSTTVPVSSRSQPLSSSRAPNSSPTPPSKRSRLSLDGGSSAVKSTSKATPTTSSNPPFSAAVNRSSASSDAYSAPPSPDVVIDSKEELIQHLKSNSNKSAATISTSNANADQNDQSNAEDLIEEENEVDGDDDDFDGMDPINANMELVMDVSAEDSALSDSMGLDNGSEQGDLSQPGTSNRSGPPTRVLRENRFSNGLTSQIPVCGDGSEAAVCLPPGAAREVVVTLSPELESQLPQFPVRCFMSAQGNPILQFGEYRYGKQYIRQNSSGYVRVYLQCKRQNDTKCKSRAIMDYVDQKFVVCQLAMDHNHD